MQIYTLRNSLSENVKFSSSTLLKKITFVLTHDVMTFEQL